MDVFETLKNAIGCSYISDLSFEPYRTRAQKTLKTMALENCSITELNDIANYFYKKHFDTADAAILFLKGQESESLVNSSASNSYLGCAESE